MAVWEEVVASLSGERLVREALLRRDPPLRGEDCAVIALGKASASMLRGAASSLGPLEGVAVLPGDEEVPQGIRSCVGEHPIPGRGSLRAGRLLLDTVSRLPHEKTALVLLSGGGSALAELPADDLSLEDLARTTEALIAAGRSIHEINAVRRALSRIKGGRLLAACTAGRVEVLALSDVEGDDPAVIASGPFWGRSQTDPRAALEVVESSRADLPQEVVAYLRSATSDDAPHAHPPCRTTLLAGPSDLQRAAVRLLRAKGWHPVPWPGFVHQDVEALARAYLRWLRRAQGPRAVLVGVGEPTLRLPPHHGRGGRALHLALRIAQGIASVRTTFLAAGSDGRDGPTSLAGACVDGDTAARARSLGVDLDEILEKADSEGAALTLGVGVPSRNTGTNLTDLHLLSVG